MESKSELELVEKSVALQAVKKFVEHHTYKKIDEYQLEDEYGFIVMAVEKGLFVIDEKSLKPVFNLTEPINTEDGLVSEIEFRTRLKPIDLMNITKNINIAKEQTRYTLVCLGYIAKLSQGSLNKLCKFDYKVVEQAASVFF